MATPAPLTLKRNNENWQKFQENYIFHKKICLLDNCYLVCWHSYNFVIFQAKLFCFLHFSDYFCNKKLKTPGSDSNPIPCFYDLRLLIECTVILPSLPTTMTLQWTFVASVLYLEIFLISCFMLPFINPKT